MIDENLEKRLDSIGEDPSFVSRDNTISPPSLTHQLSDLFEISTQEALVLKPSGINSPSMFYANPPRRFGYEDPDLGLVVGTLEGEAEDRLIYVMRLMDKTTNLFNPKYVVVVEVHKFLSGRLDGLRKLLKLEHCEKVIAFSEHFMDDFVRNYTLDWSIMGFEQFGFTAYDYFRS